jgi:hypothetical protein
VDVGDITLAVLLILGLVIIIETAFAAAFILMRRREETRKCVNIRIVHFIEKGTVRERQKILQINVCIAGYCRIPNLK